MLSLVVKGRAHTRSAARDDDGRQASGFMSCPVHYIQIRHRSMKCRRIFEPWAALRTPADGRHFMAKKTDRPSSHQMAIGHFSRCPTLAASGAIFDSRVEVLLNAVNSPDRLRLK